MPGLISEFQVDDQLFDRAEEDSTAIFSESVAYYDQQMDGYAPTRLGLQMLSRGPRVLGGDLALKIEKSGKFSSVADLCFADATAPVESRWLAYKPLDEAVRQPQGARLNAL